MLASSRRRSEIHALDFKYVRWNHDRSRVSLRVVPGFLAKNQIPAADLLSFSIPALSSSLGQSSEEDLVLCPLRALRFYLDRTALVRANKRLLFISYKKSFPADISKATISFWVKKLVRFCYELSDRLPEGPFRVRAHDTRGVSTSLALLKGVALEDILSAASWASHNTFTSFYLQEVAETSESGSLHLVAAGRAL